jgi:AcrR family transcriptional regulator
MEIAPVLSRKEQIEQLATSYFHKKGYVGTSMRDLANGLGIEAASIYSHIRSKEEILHGVCFRMADAFMAARHELEQKQLPPLEKLKAAIVSHALVVAENTRASSVFFNEYKHLSEPGLSEFLTLRAEYETWFRQLIIDGMKAGVMRDVDANFTSLTILSSINFISNWYKPEGKMTAEEIAGRIARLFIEGLIKTN